MRALLLALTADASGPWGGPGWSAAIIHCRVDPGTFELRRAGRVVVVTLRGQVVGTVAGCRVVGETDVRWRQITSGLLLVALLFGALLAFLAVILRPSTQDPVLDVVVPFASGIFTILVIFGPGSGWIAVRHRSSQRRWLESFVRGLASFELPASRE